MEKPLLSSSPMQLLGARNRRAVVAAAFGVAMCGFVAVAFHASSRSSPVSLIEVGFQPTTAEAAKADLVRAKQRVQRDIALLKTAEDGNSRQSLSVFPKYGPTIEGHKGLEPSMGGPELEHPENEFLRTPRVRHVPRFAPNKRHCPGGNCEHLDAEGVATDRWPTDIYSGMPNPAWDPEADPKRLRDQNMRVGEFANAAGRDTSKTYHAPVQWGLDDMRGNGNISPVDKGVENLDKAGVVHDDWPFDLYKSVPNPAWDKTEFDHEKHDYKMPHADPYSKILSEFGQNEKLAQAGVNINGLPTDVHYRTYNTVDGIYDRLVPVDDAPKWRKGGVARQEQPSHFLLRNDAETGIDAPQPTQDYLMGIEPAAGAEEEPEEEVGEEGEEPEDALNLAGLKQTWNQA